MQHYITLGMPKLARILKIKKILATVDDSGLILGTPEVILSGCPPLAFHSMTTWLCLVPQQDSPHPTDLLLFWCPGQHCVQVMATFGRGQGCL